MGFSKIFSHELNIICYEWREYLHRSLATLKSQKYEYITPALTFYSHNCACYSIFSLFFK